MSPADALPPAVGRVARPFRRLPDRVVVAGPSGAADVTTLAGPAAVLWDLLDAPARTDDVLASLAERFPHAARADLVDLLDELANRGLTEAP